MDGLRLAGWLLSLVLLAGLAWGIEITVTIAPENTGTFPVVSHPTGTVRGVLWNYVDWENTGSLNCDTFLRADYYDEDHNLLQTSWSGIKIIEAGDYERLETFWYPYNYSGNVSVVLRVYACKDVFPITNYTVFVNNSLPNGTDIIDEGRKSMRVSSWHDERHVYLKIESKKQLGRVIVYPQAYPLGWIFNSTSIELGPNETKTIALEYEPTLWVGEPEVVIGVVDENGTVFNPVRIALKKPVTIPGWVYALGGLVAGVWVGIGLAFLKERKKKTGSDKKNKSVAKSTSASKKPARRETKKSK